VPCAAKPNASSRTSNGGGITIVNSKNGKRVEFSKAILNSLYNPETVTIFFLDEELIIMNATEKSAFPIRTMGARKVIYNAALVHEIQDRYSLDFSN
jgi:hypothetical protein